MRDFQFNLTLCIVLKLKWITYSLLCKLLCKIVFMKCVLGHLNQKKNGIIFSWKTRQEQLVNYLPSFSWEEKWLKGKYSNYQKKLIFNY